MAGTVTFDGGAKDYAEDLYGTQRISEHADRLDGIGEREVERYRSVGWLAVRRVLTGAAPGSTEV